MIETIRSAGAHLMTLLNDILDLSKLDAGKMMIESVPTALVRLIREVGTLSHRSADLKGLNLVVRLDTPLPEYVLTDPTRLRQILMNLVSNAIKFTSVGTVAMVVRSEHREGMQRLLIDVEDTGAGLARDQSARLFAPFTQGDNTMTRRFGGTGLGLTISRRLAQLMSGNVALIHTRVGVGSCFRVDLPLVPLAGSEMAARLDDSTKLPKPESLVPPVILRGHILLAEDGRDNQRLISLYLRRAGATVDIAEHGKLALEMLDRAEASGVTYDLLLTDMQMPEMDGYTLARTLRAKGSALAIVALTAHTMAGDRDACLAAGCDDYTSKPVDKQDLLSKCATWMGGVHATSTSRDGSAESKGSVVP